jgi:DNA invertase Pin-like site-specific DNA recombinase
VSNEKRPGLAPGPLQRRAPQSRQKSIPPKSLLLLQQGLDTTTSAGKAMFQMMGVFAEFERAMIQERVRAGLARARSEGKRLGRPPIAPTLEKRIREALATPGRPGVRVIAKQFGVDPGTVQRISRPFDGGSVAVA